MSELEDRINNLLSSPEEMEKLTKMAQSIMGSMDLGSSKERAEAGEGSKPFDGLLGGIDPNILASIGKLMSDGGQNDKIRLLSALTPYLGEKRRLKMEKAIQIAKVAKIAGAVFAENGGGGGGV